MITADNAFTPKLLDYFTPPPELIQGAPYSPTSNALAERMNRLVDEAIKRRGYHLTGPTEVEVLEIQQDLNAMPRRWLDNLSPLAALFGREANDLRPVQALGKRLAKNMLQKL